MAKSDGPSRKLIGFDAATWQAVDALRNRPTTLKEMLKASARTGAGQRRDAEASATEAEEEKID